MTSKEYLELYARGQTGPQVAKNDFDLDSVVMGVMELVSEYGFTWDKNEIIPTDPKLFSDMFEAAKRLIDTTGIYNVTTKRVIHISKEEIEKGIREMPTSLTMGEGKDAYTLVARKIEDELPPAVWAGSPGCPTPERFYYENVLACAKEPVVDLLTCGSLADVDGFGVTPNSPAEVVAVRKEMEYLHRALKEVGRPGMGLLAAESAVSEVGDYAAVGEKRLRSCDAHLISVFNELVMDNGNLVRAANSLGTGIRNASLACTMVGGLAGDAPGATMLMIASILAANRICMADYHLCHPIHIKNVATTERSCLWLQAVLCQVFASVAPGIIVCDLWPASGAMTKELLYETAANTIVVTVCGGHLEGVGAANGNKPNATGLEVRLMGELGKAVARQRMTRQEANGIVLELLKKYEHIFAEKDANSGVAFDEAYDLKTVEPIPAWKQMYDEVKAELTDMGIRF